MKKSAVILSSTVICALALLLSMTAPAWAEDKPAPETWKVLTIATPVTGVQPSFLAADGGRLAWTGTEQRPVGQPSSSRMFVYDLILGNNRTIPVTLPGSYYNPSIDGPYVAYQGGTIGTRDDIWLYDTRTQQVTRITNGSTNGNPADVGFDWNPRVNEGRVVWQKADNSPRPGIYLYDAMGYRSLLLEGAEYRNPDIWENYVVCVKADQTLGVNGSQIVLLDLRTRQEQVLALANGAITTGTSANDRPTIRDGWVVWASGDIYTDGSPMVTHTYQIYAYEIASGQTIQITDNVAGNFNPSVGGTTVAWSTNSPRAIMTYDIPSHTIVQVSQLGVTGETMGRPDVDNDAIAWCTSAGLHYAVPSSKATRFLDVPRDHPYYTAIEGLADLGIVSGYVGGSSFGPGNPVIRQQFAKMIVLTMAENDPAAFTATTNDTFPFKDAPGMIANTKSGELYPYHFVSRAAMTGLTQGYEDGSFRPGNNITRAQVITMVVRAGSRVLQVPPQGYQGELDYSDPTHGVNIKIAEFNGLLDGIVGNASGTLRGWNTRNNATRGEVAQMLWNLLGKLGR